MSSFFENINPYYCFVLAVFMLAVSVVSALYYAKRRNLQLLLVALISFGLFYDTIITGMGQWLVNCSSYYAIGMLRHVFHGLLTPLIFVYVLLVCRDCGLLKAMRYTYIIYGVVLVLVVSAVISIFTSPVELIDYAGVIRHSIDKDSAHVLAAFVLKFLSFGTLIPMTAGAVVSIKYKRDYNLLVATVMMLVFTMVGVIADSSVTFLTSFVGEAFLVLFFFRYSYIQHARCAVK